MSYRADPECVAFDTFTQSWDGLMFYASPPFICISKVLQNIWQGQATEILIVPDWPSYDHLSQLIIKGFTFTLNGPSDIAKNQDRLSSTNTFLYELLWLPEGNPLS